jgi:hypothetical protein
MRFASGLAWLFSPTAMMFYRILVWVQQIFQVLLRSGAGRVRS